MFNKFKFSLVALLLLVFAFQAFPADSYNSSVSYKEEYSHVIYYGKIDYSASDSTDDIYTQAMYVGDCDMITSKGLLQVWGTSAVAYDVDVFVHGSNTNYRSAFTTCRTDTVLNDIGGGTNNNAEVTYIGHSYITATTLADAYSPVVDPCGQTAWIMLEFDGQSGNEADTDVYFFLLVKKLSNAEKRGLPRVANTVTTISVP